MSEQTDPSNQIPEGLELHKNGTALIVIDEQRFELRRPKAGEYRRLREHLEQINDDILMLAEQTDSAAGPIREERDALKRNAGADEIAAIRAKVTIQDQLEHRKRLREFNSVVDNKRAEWVRAVIASLSSTPLESSDDDLPTWFFTADMSVELIKHWQSVPSPRGVH